MNLTRFNLFFPEKRDFFLENSGIFGFGPGGNLLPFFSRRIGLSPAGTPIPIVGGARVSGSRQVRPRLSRDENGEEGATPSNNYVVGRVKRNLLRNSWVGGLMTSRNSTSATTTGFTAPMRTSSSTRSSNSIRTYWSARRPA